MGTSHAILKALGPLSVAMSLFSGSSALAQSYGDYDGDGDVDGDDFFAFGGCMTGPVGAPPGAGCDAFDFDVDFGADGFVDMADVATLQRAPTAPGGCTPGRKYAQLQKHQPGVAITGISAVIETRNVTLCQEGTAGVEKSSNAFVSVTDPVNLANTDTWYWAQTGYVRFQNANQATVNRGVFAELKVPTQLQNDWQIDLHPGSPMEPTNGFHFYEGKKTTAADGKWYYTYNPLPPPNPPPAHWKTFDHPAWVGHTGTYAKWGGEIRNKEDQMVGIAGSECVFKECKAASQYNVFGLVSITDAELFSSDDKLWGKRKRPAPGEFEIWDRIIP